MTRITGALCATAGAPPPFSHIAVALRLAFMGTPEFAVPALEKLIDAGHDIAAVYTRPPRPAGRTLKVTPSPVEQAAHRHGLSVMTPDGFKSTSEQMKFSALGLDAAVVVAYGHLLPPAVLKTPRHGCLNLHPSLLPRWRGAAPIERALMAGDTETGVTVMVMDDGLDTGPVLLSEKIVIEDEDDAGRLRTRLSQHGAGLMIHALAGLEEGGLEAKPQADTGAVYARRIEKFETRLDWTQPAQDLWHQVRGLSPAPGAWFETPDGERIRVLRAQPVTGHGACGEVLDDRATIACGRDAQRLLEVQRAGRKAMPAEVFLRGARLTRGARVL